MRTSPARPGRRSSRGMATAEYAVGVTGSVCIACVLYRLGLFGSDDWLTDMFAQITRLAKQGFYALPG